MQERTVTFSYIPASVPYLEAQKQQEARVAAIHAGQAGEHLFLVEHSPIFTCGTSANASDLLNIGDIPAEASGRGGKVTYHGPGQRVLYPVLNLNTREKDLRKYISLLQQWIINTLAHFDMTAHSDDDVGVWVSTSAGEQKIAAIGVRVRRWVTFHGIALNVCPNMEHFSRIVPCGITNKGVTSMRELGFNGALEDVDALLKHEFEMTFGCTLEKQD